MLCPEVWRFKPPQHTFTIEQQHCRKRVPNVTKTHYFNHSISVVLPDTSTVPTDLQSCLTEDVDYYRVNNLRVSELINKEFIEAFVKHGDVTLLTVGKKIDQENSIAVTPNGHLIISLISEDFQKLGLEGRASFFDRKARSRYVVTIDLKAQAFVPGKKNYEHTKTSLEERFQESFDVILAWEPPEEKLCPSSIAAWFYERGYDVSLCQQKFIKRTDYSIEIPTLEDGFDIEKFVEWLGVFSISGDLASEGASTYVNAYKCPSPSIHVGQVQHLQWTGFFTRKQVKRIFIAINEYIDARNTMPWISMDVQGFMDNPVSWDLKEHNFYMDGDNSYTIVFRPNGLIMRRSLSSNTKPKIFQ